MSDASAVGAERHADHNVAVCPLRVSTPVPLSASHTFAVLSLLPVRMRLPSGLNATLDTEAVCPLRVRTSVPLVGVPHLRRLHVTAAGERCACRRG